MTTTPDHAQLSIPPLREPLVTEDLTSASGEVGHRMRPAPRRTLVQSMPSWLLWIAAIAILYMLIVAISVIGDGFKALSGSAAAGLFDFASNPLIGLFVGILATALMQSSSTTTAIVVSAVGVGAMPIEVAVPLVMGANIGTSVTNTLASLGMVGSKAQFRRAFAAAMVHDFFNLFAVIILLPLEIFFHPIQRSAEWLTSLLHGTSAPNPGEADFLGTVTDPVADRLGVDGLMGYLPGSEKVAAVGTMLLGVAMIFLAVAWLGKVLQAVIVGKTQAFLQKAVAGKPLVAMFAGFIVTVAAQSSSVTTSSMVPFAGAGTLTVRQIYPMTLGANVGTTTTALIAAMAVTGQGADAALSIALVHTLFNVFGILILYVLPFMRELPVRCAEFLGWVASERKVYALIWVVTVFLAIPGAGIAIYALF
ncbi:Na/Pi symporter [Corynebacterium uropygiale]|uniref:Na/Pi symporter n=1 Tax=Corynebacterium uropygiale TaxID=1775911 RepID=A0A9X1QS71_9CORY|nr:Na/Pi symporter [Corynebacterium uropygiale]MCF4007412.1 Na/Pi symporter [Corynebacterium uropygiale]